MRNPLRSTSAFGLLFFILALQPAALRADSLSAAPPDQLGKVNFPTSCTAEVQPTIEKGVALLVQSQRGGSRNIVVKPAEPATK